MNEVVALPTLDAAIVDTLLERTWYAERFRRECEDLGLPAIEPPVLTVDGWKFQKLPGG